MERMSANAAKFVRGLANLTDRLAAKDILVDALHYYGGSCWELQAEKGEDAERYSQTIRDGHIVYDKLKGPDVLRVFWDDRDKVLTVQVSPVQGYSAPNEWKHEHLKGFDNGGDEVLRYVEDYLTKRFGL